MFASLRFRLWLTYALVAGVVVIIACAALVVYLLRFPASDRKELLRQRLIANLVVQRSQLLNLQPDIVSTARLQEALQKADLILNTRLAVFDQNGKLLADSRLGAATPLPDWSFVARPRLVAEAIYRDAGRQQWLYTLTPLGGGDTLLLAAPRPRVPILSLLYEDVFPPILRGAALALVLSLVMAFVIARWIAGPLNRLADAALSVSRGEFRKIPLEGPREVQEVSTAFNEMGERVQANQRAQHDFIANVSHDLKTPLTSIEGFAQAILDGTAENPAAVKQAAGVIYEEAGRMHGMVTDLLDLARLDSGMVRLEHVSIDLNNLLSRVTEEFAPQARQAQVDLRLDSQPRLAPASEAAAFTGLPSIAGDPDRLAMVFSNLLDNALKFTPPGGWVALAARAAGEWVEVQVADTGPGIPPEELERIFERFYQTDKSRGSLNRQGAGLGLAIAREIVQAHGGTIRVYNRPAETGATGSVFEVRLPVPKPEDATLACRRKDGVARAGRRP